MCSFTTSIVIKNSRENVSNCVRPTLNAWDLKGLLVVSAKYILPITKASLYFLFTTCNLMSYCFSLYSARIGHHPSCLTRDFCLVATVGYESFIIVLVDVQCQDNVNMLLKLFNPYQIFGNLKSQKNVK